MSTLLAVWMSYALLGWAADDEEPVPADVRPQVTATAPADSAPNSRGGQRRRLGEGPRRRDAGAPPGPGQRRGERMRQGPPPGPDEPLAPADVDELMRFAHDNFPQIHERLDRLRRANPREFQRMVHRIYARFKPMMDMSQVDPLAAQKAIQEHRLQIVIMGLADQYRRAESDAERARLKTEIETRIRERFDRHQERTRLEIEGLRKRLDEQERKLAQRDRDKDKLLREEFERTLKGPPPPPDRSPNTPEPDSEGPKPDSGR